VLENVVPTLLGAVKLVEVLRGLGLTQQRQRIVLNRYTTLPGSVKPADVAARLNHDVDHVIPFDKRIVVAANTGEPYILQAGRFFGCGRHLRRLVEDVALMKELPSASDSPLPDHEAEPVENRPADSSEETAQ
jgi:pilus assembly protein CpaE